ncbi:MAG: ABC transporter ATP-binding protein [Bacteroidales bacterium]|nr:ABC transporter ATP-binding protein [Clostridium sp.]MCM1204934.1 ABC transporter ATP-binding protein [Bacteroidales bacterium]
MKDSLFSARKVSGLAGSGYGRKAFRLEEVDFELPGGYIMGIVGKNGAGKTTFFDYIMDGRKRYAGELLLEGKEIHEDHLQALDRIGFVSEKNEFMEMRTAGQNAKMLGRFYSQFDMDLFECTAERLGIGKNKTVGKMSRGQRMKFQLAFAVAHVPKLLLLDEATAGMDAVFRIDVYRLLRDLIKEENCSVILSTHIEEEIEKQLDYVGVLEKGRFISFRENLPV